MRKFNLPVVVAINKFITDTDNELDIIQKICEEKGVKVALLQMVSKGGEGGFDLVEFSYGSIARK